MASQHSGREGAKLVFHPPNVFSSLFRIFWLSPPLPQQSLGLQETRFCSRAQKRLRTSKKIVRTYGKKALRRRFKKKDSLDLEMRETGRVGTEEDDNNDRLSASRISL